MNKFCFDLFFLWFCITGKNSVEGKLRRRSRGKKENGGFQTFLGTNVKSESIVIKYRTEGGFYKTRLTKSISVISERQFSLINKSQKYEELVKNHKV